MADRDEPRRADGFARIRQWGDPALRAAARPVERFDAALGGQIAEMTEIMEDVGGAGLAAPQIGRLNRVLVYRPDAETAPRALVNPVILSRAGSERDLEGCLSLGRAQVHVAVERAGELVVEATGAAGECVRVEAAHGHARVLQHEIDHLDGILMLDRADPAQRRAALHALATGVAWSPGA
jgi:peptide deformylase